MVNARTKAKIEARIHERAAYCVEFELNDPRAAFITITRVEVSSDLATAKIFYSMIGDEGDRSRVAHMLEDASGFVRRQVGRVLRTRRIPKLRWFFDDSIERAQNMDRAIRAALERDREINPGAHDPGAHDDGSGEGQAVDHDEEEALRNAPGPDEEWGEQDDD